MKTEYSNQCTLSGVVLGKRKKGKILFIECNHLTMSIPVMAAVAARKKVVSIGHFSPSFYLQSLQFFLFIRLNQELLYESIALKIRKK